MDSTLIRVCRSSCGHFKTVSKCRDELLQVVATVTPVSPEGPPAHSYTAIGRYVNEWCFCHKLSQMHLNYSMRILHRRTLKIKCTKHTAVQCSAKGSVHFRFNLLLSHCHSVV